MLIAFFLSPFVVHHLGTSAYGLWILIMSITSYLGLLDLGVRGSVTCYVAKFYTQGKHEEASHLVSSALALFTLLGATALAVSVILGLIGLHLFRVPESLRPNLQAVLILAGASIAITLVSNVYGAIVIGLQRFELSNAIEIGSGILKAFVVLLALRHGKGLVTLAIIQLAFSLTTALVFACTSWRIYPQLSVGYQWSDWANVRLIFSFASYLFLLNASAYLILYTDSVVIGAFLPVAMITFFAIAGNLIASSRSLISGISTIMTPLASSLDAEGHQDKIKQIGLAGPRYATMLVLPIAVTFVLRGETFIGLWMGFGYAIPSGKVLQVLSLTLFFSAANQVATSTMLGLCKHRPLVLVNIAEGLLNLALSVGLVRVMGIIGVAWGTAIPSVATSLVFWPLYIRRVFAIRSSQYVYSTWGRPAIAAIPFALVSLMIDKTWYAPTVWFFFLQVLVTLPVAIFSFWFGCFSRTERRSHLGQIVSRTIRVEETA
jgi:O-antigen/teichoic acid export membrane protein